ncbi:MAG: acyl-ACP--UDP-N-acetylglucosamine O-acyltransferase [Leptospiraceae bacterium]|nr:acyl-ACP--UDP-N-acetylglucosamine O-acyltransferase [Leptospiraceae bacterium]MDW8306863.1 acyl-ACP--UDP-N-acetylglucosamine O-acyltransferase [Leptospiraceae bacterium]
MPKIHPTAIVESGAELAEDVEIGPYSIIGPQVKIGKGTKIGAHVVFRHRVEVGEYNTFHDMSVIGDIAQDVNFHNWDEAKVVIGSHNIFREHITIHQPSVPGNTTKIGSHCYFMATTHVAHDCQVGDHVIMVNQSGLAGHAIIHDHAFISGNVMVHQYCRVGAYAILGGGTKVTRDVPPFCMVNGNPALAYGLNVVGLRRAKFTPEERSAIKQAFQILYLKDHSISKAIEILEKEFLPTLSEGSPRSRVAYFIEFLKGTKRGIVFHHSRKGGGEEPDIE